MNKTFVMRHKIELTLNDFCNFSKLQVEYDLSLNKGLRICIIENKRYTVVWRSEIRKSSAERLLRLHRGEEVIIVSNKIYGPARSLFIEKGMNYFEYEGNFYFKAKDILKIRRKDNNYDRRANYARMCGHYGSQFIIAPVLERNLLNNPVSQIASVLNMGKSTVYYYLRQFRAEKVLIKNIDTQGYKWYKEPFSMKSIINNLFIRGYANLIVDNFAEPLISKASYLFGNSVPIKKQTTECLFYDSIMKHKFTLSDLIYGKYKDHIVLISPFNKDKVPSLDTRFREKITEWYTEISSFSAEEVKNSFV